jgi:FAD/FMN-containing dehydrogenase
MPSAREPGTEVLAVGRRTTKGVAGLDLVGLFVGSEGTLGEHGVGILKRDAMRRELDPGSLALQSAVRHALDPREIFNPGKG